MLHGRFADLDTTPYTSLMSSPLDSTPTQKITASVTVNVTRNGAFISSDFKTSFEFCFSQFFSSVFCQAARPLDRSTARQVYFETKTFWRPTSSSLHLLPRSLLLGPHKIKFVFSVLPTTFNRSNVYFNCKVISNDNFDAFWTPSLPWPIRLRHFEEAFSKCLEEFSRHEGTLLGR